MSPTTIWSSDVTDTLNRAWKRDTDEIAKLAERVGSLVQGFNDAIRDFQSLTRYSHDDTSNRMKNNWSGEFVRYDDVMKLLKRLKQ